MICTLPIVALCCTENNRESNQLTRTSDDKSTEEKSTAENTGLGSIFRRVVFQSHYWASACHGQCSDHASPRNAQT